MRLRDTAGTLLVSGGFEVQARSGGRPVATAYSNRAGFPAVRVKEISGQGERRFVVVLDTGEEAVDCLLAFARENRVTAAAFTGLGAFRDATLGFFDMEKKDYERIRIDEQVEVVTLLGNFATKDGEAKLHPHVVVSKRNGQAFGGHLLEAHVRPTLEVVVTETPADLRRQTDPETGLPLLAL
jgi:predicted DNA-binding protein with PD1-like motif